MNDGYYDTTVQAAFAEEDKNGDLVLCFDVEFENGETTTARQFTGNDTGKEYADKLMAELGIIDDMEVAVGQPLLVLHKTASTEKGSYQNAYVALSRGGKESKRYGKKDAAAALRKFRSSDETPF